MRKQEEDDIDSEESEDLKEEELIAMNRHFRHRKTNRNSKMNSEMETLYKEALMDTFFGRFEQASKKLKSHIVLCPDHSESYHLLGTMYQELGEYRNAVEYFFMSAYLSPPNFQKWKKVGEMSFELQRYNQAAYCFGRALKIQNYNIELMTRRAEAFQHSHQTKKAISTYKKILSITFSLQILKQYAKLRFKRGEYKTAREILMEYRDHQKDPHLAYMICETYLKEDKFEEVLQYLACFIEHQKSEEQGFRLESLNVEFTIFLFICLVRLDRDKYQALETSAEQVKRVLVQGYQESYSKEYEVMIGYIKQNEAILKQTLLHLIKFKAHKTVQNYLLLTELLKKQENYELAIQLLKEALKINRNSVELTSQLNHIKIVSGTWKETKRREVFDFKKTIKNQAENDEDIFYSDDEHQKSQLQHQNYLNRDDKPENASKNKKKQPKSTKQNLSSTNKSSAKNSLQTQDPLIIKCLLANCNQTLESIVKFYEQEARNVSSCFKQVEDCVNFILNLTASQKQQDREEKEGLINRNYRRRRYFSSKQSNRLNIINSNLPSILMILENVIVFIKTILNQQQFSRVKHLAQMLSKAYFFRWQNKSFELKRIKKQLYQMGLLACLSLEKYETAVFFVKYLVHKQPDNSFYLLVVNYLIQNSTIKVCMGSLLGKFAARNNLLGNNNNSILKSNGKNLELKSQNQQNFFQDEQISENLSYPRKMSNFSNISDIVRDNLKLNYLFGIEYMETGCFDLAISSFLKIINLCEGEIKKTIWLCLSSCFVQISSSRTCHSKMPHTNASTYCFWQYLNSAEDEMEKLFNKARFFAQLRINAKAIELFEKVLEIQAARIEEQQIQQRSAHCLMCIYKDIEDWDKLNQITLKYFSLSEQQSKQPQPQHQESQHSIELEYFT